MPHIELEAISKKIKQTQEELEEIRRFGDPQLRTIMSSELENRLAILEQEKANVEAASSKECISLRIYGDSVEPGRISSRVLLSALSGFQYTLDSIANAMFHSPTSRGKIPESIKNTTCFEVVGSFAGSFGLMLERQEPQSGIEAGFSNISRALSEMFDVLETVDNSDQLITTISPFGKRTVKHYRQWLEELSESNVNLQISWKNSAASTRQMHLLQENSQSIISTLDTIDSIKNEETDVVGVLNGVNIRNHTFEISTDEFGLVKGTALPEVLMSILSQIGTEILAHTIKSTSLTKAGIIKTSWYLSDVEEVKSE